MGGNRALQDAYRCRITIPAGEAPLIDRWDERELVLGFADQRAERFRHDDTLAAGDTLRLGDVDWRPSRPRPRPACADVLSRPISGILISGDALWEDGFGVVFPALFGDLRAFGEARATLESIAKLGVRTVIPGHGRVFTDVAARPRALRSTASTATRKTSPDTPGTAAKALLVFALLENRRMAVADLPRYCAEVGILRELNARHLRMGPQPFAEWLVADLERARAIAREGGDIAPLVRA